MLELSRVCVSLYGKASLDDGWMLLDSSRKTETGSCSLLGENRDNSCGAPVFLVFGGLPLR